MAFERLKKAMTSLPILAIPYFDKELVIKADASSKGVGAILMQEGHLVAYMSKCYLKGSKEVCIRERVDGNNLGNPKVEALLIREALVVHTDQKSLKHILDQRMMGEEQQKLYPSYSDMILRSNTKWERKTGWQRLSLGSYNMLPSIQSEFMN